MKTERVSRKVSARGVWIRPILLSVATLLASFTIPLLPLVGEAASCTRGVNCYCDRVKKVADPIYDAALLMCEDFEAPTLHDDVGFGGGAPNFGPWYDNTEAPGYRGVNSYWRRTYGDSIDNCSTPPGTPATPTVGVTCNPGPCGIGAWRADNRWQANSFACINVVRNGEFGAEDPNVLPPTNGRVPGVFDGNQSFAFRIGVGAGRMNGIIGTKSWTPQFASLGLTLATAFPSNIANTGVLNSPWKGNDMNVYPNALYPWTHVASGLTASFPFSGGGIYYNGETQAGCIAKLAAATVRKGTLTCLDVALTYRADPVAYVQSRNYPLGTWGCMQYHYRNMNSTNMGITLSINGVPFVDFDGFDDRLLGTKVGISSFDFNAYANANQGGVDVPTTAVAYRYEDNIHIRAGAPVSCAQIGFSGIPAGPPSAPSGLEVR